MHKRKERRRATAALSAKTADKHELYEAAVQNTQADIHFIDRVFARQRGRKPVSLCEDFCGTAKLCADWVRQGPERLAFGLDLHEPTLAWGRQRHLAALDAEAAARVRLLRRDVLRGMAAVAAPVDVKVAFNFSYCVFKQRPLLLRYLQRARRDLNESGAFMLDIHGGTESFSELEEAKKLSGFTYVWEQEPFDVVAGCTMRHIHFRFPDGSRLRRAFSYDWRLWTLPEMRDALQEAGFARTEVYWEGCDRRGAGNGIFRRVQRARDELSWVAYVVAWV